MDPLPELTVEEWYPHVRQAFRDWRSPAGAEENPLFQLQFIQEKVTAYGNNRPDVHRLLLNEALLPHLRTIQKQEPDQGEILRRRYLDGEKIRAVADELDRTKDEVTRLQRRGLETITAVVLQLEQAARERRVRQLETSLLPSTYQVLFGVEEMLDELESKLLSPTAPPVIALVGLGGIGKTASADAVTRRILRRFCFDRIIWYRVGSTPDSAPTELTVENLMSHLAGQLLPHLPADTPVQERNEQIRHILKATPCLVVIDNLESTVGTGNWPAYLNDLAKPSKFLLTSRTQISDPAGVFQCFMRELSAEHAGELIRDRARRIGLGEPSDEQVEAIFSIAGGHPLALKLVVGLAGMRPLHVVLDDLQAAFTPKVEHLYQDIYWQAWRSLSRPAQKLLEIMPLGGPTGMDPEQMQRLSQLGEAEFWPAVEQLVHCSLLEVWGSPEAFRYATHRLTESFLQTSITGWTTESL